MTVTQFRGRGKIDTSDQAVPPDSVLDVIVEAINNPRFQNPEVAEAIATLSAAAGWGSGTGPLSWSSPSSTTGASQRFDGVVTLLTEVIRELDLDESHDYLFAEALPHFVPDGWSDFLRRSAVEDSGFALPWLAEFDD